MADHTFLAENATLRDLVPTLDNPIKFVTGAFGVIDRHELAHGPVILRIGVSRNSKGKRPNYCIDAKQTGKAIEAIDGNNHKPWPDGTNKPNGEWSKKWMTHAQVQTLLDELRHSTGVKGIS